LGSSTTRSESRSSGESIEQYQQRLIERRLALDREQLAGARLEREVV
jgi:hypothetical protein